jgi:L-fuconolactonase
VRVDAFQFFTHDHPPEHLGPILSRNRFDGSVAFSLTPTSDPRDLLHLAGPHDYVKAAIPCIDPRDPSLVSLLDACARFPKFRGVFFQLGDSIPDSLREIAGRNLTVDLQLAPSRLPLVAAIAAAFPDLRIAILHLGSPAIGAASSDTWARDIAGLARYANVFCKASDLIHLGPQPWNGAALRPYMQHVLASFGPARVMFGSGWPSGLPDHIWKETLAAFTQAIGAQTMEVREELLGGTAQRFYGIQ